MTDHYPTTAIAIISFAVWLVFCSWLWNGTKHNVTSSTSSIELRGHE